MSLIHRLLAYQIDRCRWSHCDPLPQIWFSCLRASFQISLNWFFVVTFCACKSGGKTCEADNLLSVMVCNLSWGIGFFSAEWVWEIQRGWRSIYGISPAEVLPSFVAAYQCCPRGFRIANVFGSQHSLSLFPWSVGVWTCLSVFAFSQSHLHFAVVARNFHSHFPAEGRRFSPYFPLRRSALIYWEWNPVQLWLILTNFAFLQPDLEPVPDPEPPKKLSPYIYQVDETKADFQITKSGDVGQSTNKSYEKRSQTEFHILSIGHTW